MILKKMKRTVFTKPKATMISGLVDYILQSHDAGNRKNSRISAPEIFFPGLRRDKRPR
jgi:hypothetical protein